MEIITCKAPINMAVIKYWGKRDEALILPLNDSVSVTISTDIIYAKTTVAVSPDFKEDRMWLNGREEPLTNPRLVNCLSEIKELSRKSKNLKTKAMLDWRIHICSENNFPTAAGLASSAAGYACLVYALAKLFQIEGDLTPIARRGSGSACRSIHGGFVIWKMGSKEDGSDSIAKQIAPASHWEELKVLILVVNSEKKAVGSSLAMQRSTVTSDFLMNVNGGALEDRVNQLTDAILRKDFDTFAHLTMKDSNRLHSVCLDTFPPVLYLNDVSHYIIQMVHFLNDHFGKPKVAYSFDAGPNACLFLLEKNAPIILSIINHFLPPIKAEISESYFRGKSVDVPSPPSDLVKAIPLTPRAPGAIKGIIYVGVGEGPKVLKEDEHLLDANGLPLTLT